MYELQARTILDVPIPKVLAWCIKADNAVGAEYILMEEALGTPLPELWDQLELNDKVKIMDDIINLEKKMLSVSFNQ
jgi:hypothetical protein